VSLKRKTYKPSLLFKRNCKMRGTTEWDHWFTLRRFSKGPHIIPTRGPYDLIDSDQESRFKGDIMMM